jgi:hypothetical protein
VPPTPRSAWPTARRCTPRWWPPRTGATCACATRATPRPISRAGRTRCAGLARAGARPGSTSSTRSRGRARPWRATWAVSWASRGGGRGPGFRSIWRPASETLAWRARAR